MPLVYGNGTDGGDEPCTKRESGRARMLPGKRKQGESGRLLEQGTKDGSNLIANKECVLWVNDSGLWCGLSDYSGIHMDLYTTHVGCSSRSPRITCTMIRILSFLARL